MSFDSFATRTQLAVNGKSYTYFSLPELGKRFDLSKLPYSMKILLENLLRHEDGGMTVGKDHIEAVAQWDARKEPDTEIAFMPARVVLQDFTGVPCVVDLAAMRDAVARLGGSPKQINPLIPSELVIDHSVQVDVFGRADALELNGKIEFERNMERYSFLRWGQKALQNFKVVPPNTGIVHQVNLENLARVVMGREVDGDVAGVPRHRLRHRFAHHHDQRHRRARLGRGRHRSGSRDAGATVLDADPAGGRLQADRQAAGRARPRPTWC